MGTLGRICCLLALAGAVGCGDPAALVDPSGTWNVTVTWGGGDCDLKGVEQDIFTVTKNGSASYLISSSDPKETTTGTFECDSSQCKLSMQRIGSFDLSDGSKGTANQAANLTLGTDNRITGAGSASVTTASVSCTQQYSAMGMKS